MKVVIVSNDDEYSELLAAAIKRSFHEVRSCRSPDDAIMELHHTRVDLFIIDVAGWELDVLREARSNGFTLPIIILAAKDDLQHRVQSFNEGADDYLIKPFAILEFEARVRRTLRRAAGGMETIRFHALEVGMIEPYAAINGKQLEVTGGELAILRTLVRSTSRTATRDQLLNAVYDNGSSGEAALMVHVSRLRKKLLLSRSDLAINSLKGYGYSLIVMPPSADHTREI